MDLEIQPTIMEPLLTIPQVAKVLAVSDATVYRLAEKKELASIRFMGTVRVRKADLEAFLQAHQVEMEK